LINILSPGGTKECLNDYSAGEGPGIYSNPARHSVCVNEIMIVNCEGSKQHFLAVHIVLTVVKCHRKELMTVINIYHRQSTLYCDGRGDEAMSFDFTHRS
jgi:hypothetical protein